MLDHLLSATSETHYLSSPRSFNVEIGVLKVDLDALSASPIRLFSVDELRHLVAGVRIELLLLIPNEACNRYTAPAMYLRHPADT